MGQASRAPELRPPAAAAQQGPRWCVWPDYSSRRSNIATSMAGSITTCSIASSVPMSAAMVPTVESPLSLGGLGRLGLGGEPVAWVAAHENVRLGCEPDTQRLSHHVWGRRRAGGAMVAAADRAAFVATRPRRSPGGQLARGTPGSPRCRSGTSGLARPCRRAPHKGPVLAIRSVRRRATPHAWCTR
jgi:hypothetical protein